jgi:ubiquinone/menaquinone biosynthesis C-methylase UbiE
VFSVDVSTRDGYAIWSSTYDGEKNALIAVEEPAVLELISSLPITNALDVGAGTGRHTLPLARRGVYVTAVDQSPEMLAIARQKAQQENLPIDFHVASLTDGLPFASNQFDFLINALMLCHVSDIAAAVHECCRVVRPGGHLLITDFHPDAIDYGWRTSFTYGDVKYALPNTYHTRSGYLQALTNEGCILQKVIDIPVRAIPTGYGPEEVFQKHLDLPFCFIVLAQRPSHQ